MNSKKLKLLIITAVWLISYIFVTDIHAQNVRSLFFENPGLEIGSFSGNTQFRDNTFNYSFRYYNRYAFRESVYGEFGLSIGFISGPSYRSRLIPIEYRLGYTYRNFFGYAGLGLLHHTPIDVPNENDPFLGDGNQFVSNSPFWTFDRNIAPHIPFGIGYTIGIDTETNINFSLGYNQSLNSLRLNSDRVPDGYWAFSIGINFNRKRTVPPSPQPIPVVTPASPQLVTQPILATNPLPEEKENTIIITDTFILDRLNNSPLHFKNFSSHLDREAMNQIKEMANLLNTNRDLFVHIYGHADSTGTSQINDAISQSRARAVWLALINEGVDPHRLNISWFGDQSPVNSSVNMNEELENKRVEFILNSTKQNNYRRFEIGLDDTEIEPGSPLLNSEDFIFNWLDYGKKEKAEYLMANIANMIRNRNDIEIFVASISDPLRSSATLTELDKSRSDKVRAHLIKLGIEPEKLQSYNPYNGPLPQNYQRLLKPGLEQQLLIVPVEREYIINQEPSEVEMVIYDAGGFNYYIVGGSFIMRNNADRFLSILKNEGFSPHLLFDPDTNWNYVAYAGFQNESEAIRYLRSIRELRQSEAWLLRAKQF